MDEKKTKLFILMLCFIMLIFIASCGSYSADKNSVDGVAFSYMTTLSINYEEISVYELSELKSLYYYCSKLESKNINNWIINYIFDYDYYLLGENGNEILFQQLYDYLIDNSCILFNLIEGGVSLKNDGFQEELEFSNSLVNGDELYIVKQYIPFKLDFKNAFSQKIVLVPISSFIAKKNGDLIMIGDEHYSYHELLLSQNLFLE